MLEKENRKMVFGGWLGKGGMWSYCLMGIEFQFYKMKIFVEGDGGDSYTKI